MKKGVLGNFIKFTGKHLRQSLFFNKVAGLRLATLLKRRLWYRCFPVNFAKFLRTPFLKENIWTTASGRTTYCFAKKDHPKKKTVSLNQFLAVFLFYAPWKHQKTSGFLVSSKNIKRENRPEMGWYAKMFVNISMWLLESILLRHISWWLKISVKERWIFDLKGGLGWTFLTNSGFSRLPAPFS